MGGAASSAPHSQLKTEKTPALTTIKNPSSMGHCAACRTSLNIFIRKKCCACNQFHCSRCLVPSPGENGNSRIPTRESLRRRVCVKCAMLISGDYTRDDLVARYTVRELRTFLIGRHIVIDGCREKADLIELAMRISHAPSQFLADDLEHTIHVARLKEKMMTELQSEVCGVSASNPVVQEDNSMTPATSEAGRLVPDCIDPPEVESMSDANIESDFVFISASAYASDGQETVIEETEMQAANHDSKNGPEMQRSSVYHLGDVSDCRENESATSSPLHRPIDQHQHVTLIDIKDITVIDALTIRQLKELLVNNFVDYKGCCEKKELLERVRQLWTDHNRNASLLACQSDGESLPSASFDDNLCKVCMDAVIDCVLLECGHMVACTKCGKQLTECPVCRHYVCRVVHVFRA